MTLSLAAVVADAARRRPRHPALVHDGTTLTYDGLWDGVRRYAAVLRGHGVRPGDRVALLLANTPDFALVYFGALALGAVVVPVHALLKADEIAYVLADSGSTVLVCAAELLTEGAPAARRTDTALLDAGTLAAAASTAGGIAGYVTREPADIAVVLYTSGTTGRPKGAMLTHLNLVMNVTVTMLSPFDLGLDDVVLCPLPLFHTFGQICAMATCFRAGGTLVLMSRFNAASALALMAEHACTVFMGVPTMYHALLAAIRSGAPRPVLDRAYSGGSALPIAVLEDVEREFGCPVYEGYGLTETSPVVAYNQKAWPRRPGTVCHPIWGVAVEIARADCEDRIELLPAGSVGEIVIRGHNVMAGYLNRPEDTAAVLVDGWFRSGDLGCKSHDGYLSIVDRKKDMVVRGGYNVYPREIEEVLVRHAAVAQVAVIGVPDDQYGEEVCAVIVPRPGHVPDEALAAEIVGWARTALAAYKYPRRVEFVDLFPLGPSGKVLKRELAAHIATLSPFVRIATDLLTNSSSKGSNT